MAEVGTQGRSASQTAGGTKKAAKDEAKQAIEQSAQQASQEVQEVAQQAKGKVQEQLSTASSTASEQAKVTAQGLRTLSQELRQKDQPTPAGWIDQVADRAERLGNYLDGADAQRLRRDLEDFGRRNPEALALGGLAVGFAIARFLKASPLSDADDGSSRLDETTS